MVQKIYLLSPWRLWAVPAVFACLVALVLLASLFTGSLSDSSAPLLTGLILAIMGASLVPLVRYPRLVVSSRGITQRQMGWQVSTAWDNVERLEVQPGNEGLYLRQALTGTGAWALRVGRYLPGWYTAEQHLKAGEGRWFPLQPFGWWFRHGDLLEEIERHLPVSGSRSSSPSPRAV